MRKCSAAVTLAGVALTWGGLGCATAGPAQPSTASTPEAFFPLAPGNAWSYDVDGTLVVVRVEARDGTDVRMGDFGYQVRPAGIVRVPPGKYVLKLPLEMGTSWELPGGGRARIVQAGARVATPAGTFAGCVVVEEADDAGVRTRTTFAPGVGPVDVVVSGGGSVTHAVLRGFTRAGDEI